MARRLDFKGRVVWITGASTGIGRSCALEFARRGAMVAVSARSAEKLEALVGEIGAQRALAVALDVTSPEANRAAVEQILGRFGHLDIAFFNAGMWQAMELEDFSAGIFEDHMRVNFMGMVHGIEAALPALYQSTRPHLVGMSSSVAYRGMPRGEAYCASKAAIRAMLQGLRVQLRRRRVPVTIICPGFVRSPLTDKNDFEMPFLMEPADAARIIVDGVARGTEEIDFPKRLTWMLKFLSILPSPIYTSIMYKAVQKR